MKLLNKKGDGEGVSTFKLLMGVILVLALFGIALYFIVGIPDAASGVTNITKMRDFDGDNHPPNWWPNDLADPCPCGIDNTPRSYKGMSYCVNEYSPEQCTLAEKVLRTTPKYSGTSVDDFFYAKTDDGQQFCIYTLSGCTDLRKTKPTFNLLYAQHPEELRKEVAPADNTNTK